MTAPVVAQVSVEVLADAKNLAKSLRAEVEAAFKGLDLSKLVRDSLGNTKISLPVEPDLDTDGLGEKVRRTRVPKIPVDVDPLTAAFAAEIKRQTAALAKEVNVKVPVDTDTTGLREELGAQLKAVATQAKATVPVEPGDKAKFQTELQQQLAEVSARIKAHVGVEADTQKIPAQIRQARIPAVKVQVDPLLAAFQAEIKRETAALARTVNAKIPVGADGSRLRADLGAELAAIQHELKATVPTEPGARAEYEAKLKAMVAAASERVKASIKTEPEKGPDFSGLSGLVGGLLPSFAGISGAVTGIGSLVQGLAGGVEKLATSAAEGGSQLGESVAAAAGPVGAIVAGLASAAAAAGVLGAAATILVPTFTAAAGAAAAIPAALAGLGAAAGTLDLGFKGISEAFKPPAAGGSAAQQAATQGRQIAAAGRAVEAARRGIASANRGLEASERSLAAAERGVASAQRGLVDAELAVTDAQKRAAQAQVAVNKARVEATNDLVDLNLQLKGSKLSEEEATQGVTDALRALNTAKLTGNIPDITKADLAYQRAQLTLQQAAQSSKELQQQADDTNKKGVEGSDKVQSALQEQTNALQGVHKAQEGVLDAQNGIISAADGLKSAQDGVLSAQDGIKSATDGLISAQDSLAQAQQSTAASAAAAAAKLIPLAASAQRFVDAIKALKPAFESLRLDVQQRLFAGLDQTVTHLGAAWIPALKTTLGSYADTFNGFFRSLGTAVSTPKFITDLQAGAEGFRQGLSLVADAVTSRLVPALGALSNAAGPFLKQLGAEVAGIVTEFSNWVLQGEKTGGLATFFAKATKALHEIFTTGKLVFKIVGDLFSTITGAQQASGTTPLDALNNGLKKIDAYLSDPKHQQQISNFLHDLATGLQEFGHLVASVNDFLGKIGLGAETKGGSVGADIGKALVAGLLAGLVEAVKISLEAMLLPFQPLIDGIKEYFGIKSPSTVMAAIGHDLIAGLLQGIRDRLASLATTAAQVPVTVGHAVGNAGQWLYSHGRDAVTGLGNGIVSLFGNLSSRAAGLRTAIGNALSNAGSILSAAGRNVVIGLVNGIIAQIPGLGSILSFITDFIRAHKGPPEKDKVLLYGAGRLIMGGLISGIGDQKQALAAELADVTSLVAGTALSGLGAHADAAITASLQASSQQQLAVAWKTGTTGDQILDALARHIDVQFNGNVQQAFSRT